MSHQPKPDVKTAAEILKMFKSGKMAVGEVKIEQSPEFYGSVDMKTVYHIGESKQREAVRTTVYEFGEDEALAELKKTMESAKIDASNDPHSWGSAYKQGIQSVLKALGLEEA